LKAAFAIQKFWSLVSIAALASIIENSMRLKAGTYEQEKDTDIQGTVDPA